MYSSHTSVNTDPVIQTSQINLYDKETTQFGNKSCWSRRSSLERGLIIAIVICLLLVIALLIAVIVIVSKDTGEEEKAKVCSTKECVIAAGNLAQNIDDTMDPCDDFYAFSCGQWRKSHVIPEDKSEYNQFTVLSEDVQVILKGLLEDNQTFTNAEVLLKPRSLYAACMNLAKLEELGDAPLRALLSGLGGWPMVNQSAWTEETFDLTGKLVELFLMHNTKPILTSYVYTDLKNSSERIIYLDQPGFGLPGQKYYLVERNDSKIVAYETLMRNIALELGANPNTVNDDIKDVVDFEIQLANISVPSEERRDPEALYNVYTRAQLNTNFTGVIDFERYFNELFNHGEVQVPLNPEEPIVNQSPEYFTKLVELLANTPNRTVANYLMWRIAFSYANNLNEKYRGFEQDYRKVLSGTETPPARFRTCSDYAVDVLGMAVGHMFVSTSFDLEARRMTLDMINQLQKAFNELVDELDWMDAPTKTLAKEKNDYIEQMIGFPDSVLNITHLTQLYQNYAYDVDDLFNNVVNDRKQSALEGLRELRKPIDKSKWHLPPSVVNAYYSPTRNQIVFPAGILQPPFFSKNYPKSLNYGGMGSVIGHEITHGFDDRGRQYDKFGNLQQWWSESVIERFKDRAQCIINQYGNYTVPEADKNLNGINTQGENIADNGGVKESFRAYRNWVGDARNGEEEPRLPGLPYDNNQLFFINWARVWCTNMRKERALLRILVGVHSPGQFRVNGPLQNSVEFAQAFQCPAGSRMNPARKCVVW